MCTQHVHYMHTLCILIHKYCGGQKQRQQTKAAQAIIMKTHSCGHSHFYNSHDTLHDTSVQQYQSHKPLIGRHMNYLDKSHKYEHLAFENCRT